MRRRSNTILSAFSLLALVLAFAFFGYHSMASWATDLTGRILTPLTERVVYGQGLLMTLVGKHDLVKENMDLRTELERAKAAVAVTDELKRENDFLRTAVQFRQKVMSSTIEGGIFAYVSLGGVRAVEINRGQADGVTTGDVVVTAAGELIGLVRDVGDRHSSVEVLGDPSLEVTSRVVGTDITGLLRVDAKNGLVLDLIQKDEDVNEGQSLATSGNDRLPAGLLIGTIRSVDTESATLFKIVRITPAWTADASGKVLILHP